jgi:hypothetical protein
MLPPGMWFYEDGVLMCAGAVAVAELEVDGQKAEIQDLKARIEALERKR